MRSILISLCLFCSLSFSAFAASDDLDTPDVVASAAVVDPTPTDTVSDSILFPETDVTSDGIVLAGDAPSDVEGVGACDPDVASCVDASSDDVGVNPLPTEEVTDPAPAEPAPVVAPTQVVVSTPPVESDVPKGQTFLVGLFVTLLIAALRKYTRLDSIIPKAAIPSLAVVLGAITGSVWSLVAATSFATTLLNSGVGGFVATGIYELVKNAGNKLTPSPQPVRATECELTMG